jgi:NAD(P)-dependent dehydrogenase (short-subunit alcohol dehydrogenase family)
MRKQVALVTGGSRGIGLGIARRLAGQGIDLAVNGMRPEEQVRETLDELRGLGVEVAYVPGDIGDSSARERIIGAVRERFGRLNWLVNNAGVAPRQRLDLLETTEESFNRVVNTNLGGAFFLSQLAARWLVEQKQADTAFRGGIVNVSSISATVVSINRGEYCIAKAGLSMATQLFAVRLGEYDLPVYEVRPGVTKTDMTAGVTEKYDKLIADGLCVTPRWGFPEDIGRAVGALVRGDFPYSTGQVIMVDGGLTIPRL